MKRSLLILTSILLCANLFLTSCVWRGLPGNSPDDDDKPYFIMPEEGSSGLEYRSNGDGTCTVVGMGACTDTKLIIPSYSPTGDLVTGVGENAFGDDPAKLELDFYRNPDTTIYRDENGNRYYLYNGEKVLERELYRDIPLEEVVLSDSVTSIGNWAFFHCENLLSIRLPDGITSIGDHAFRNCTHLASLTIPAKIKTIGDRAFYNCGVTGSIAIPSGATSIGPWAFRSCKNLTSVTVNAGMTNESKFAFADCPNLSNVVIGDGVTMLSEYAFYQCKNLNKVTISGSVNKIDVAAFNFCDNLKTIVFKGTPAQWNAIVKIEYWNYNCQNYSIEFAGGGASMGNGWTDCSYCSAGYVTCSRCGGEGMVFGYYQNGRPIDITCGGCGGSGMDDCPRCNGIGQVEK